MCLTRNPTLLLYQLAHPLGSDVFGTANLDRFTRCANNSRSRAKERTASEKRKLLLARLPNLRLIASLASDLQLNQQVSLTVALVGGGVKTKFELAF